jgi:hypothetical protein
MIDEVWGDDRSTYYQVVEIFISEARERGQQIQTDLSEENWHSL